MYSRLNFALAIVAALAGCQSSGAAKPAESSSDVSLTGSRIIGCCCASPCPCRLNKPPMYCHGCDFTTAVHIDNGHIGKTDMTGVTWVLVGRGFGEQADNLWAYAYVSNKASKEQVQALADMLMADAKKIAPERAPYILGKFLGMRQVPMTYQVSPDKRDYNCSIPGILDLKTRSIILPGHKEPVVSTGIFDAFGDRFVHADCLTHTFNDPEIKYKWDLTGRQCNQADFVLTSERLAQGGIGWGCWTANKKLGSKDDYEERIATDRDHDHK